MTLRYPAGDSATCSNIRLCVTLCQASVVLYQLVDAVGSWLALSLCFPELDCQLISITPRCKQFYPYPWTHRCDVCLDIADRHIVAQRILFCTHHELTCAIVALASMTCLVSAAGKRRHGTGMRRHAWVRHKAGCNNSTSTACNLCACSSCGWLSWRCAGMELTP